MPVTKIYDGKVTHEEYTHFIGVAEVVLDDGRTVQVAFSRDGTLMVRAWGNTPLKVKNVSQLTVSCNIKYQGAEDET